MTSPASLLERTLRRTIRVLGTGALTAGHAVGYAIAARVDVDDPEALRQRWVRNWSQSLLTLFSIDVQVTGVRQHSGAPGRLIVANHRSPVDVLLLLNAFAGYIVSRADLARWPIVGPSARVIGTVFVDRSDNASGASAVQTIQRLLAQGRDVILFPEATIFEGDEVRPFKRASFAVARRVGASVLPVGIAYESGAVAVAADVPFMEHVVRAADAPRTCVILNAGAPIDATSCASTESLVAAAHTAVQQLVNYARAAVDAGRR